MLCSFNCQWCNIDAELEIHFCTMTVLTISSAENMKISRTVLVFEWCVIKALSAWREILSS
ncbi:hypothetical protein COCON_G00235200 [Conger conger]|uniref:Uncharacterized protein n=1 Tax=Conger conger TaxID=82655 RepID=A0A9Q1CUL6_CONCO|nr:hypothetical protein COCON_G00235200 [Conger conger]